MGVIICPFEVLLGDGAGEWGPGYEGDILGSGVGIDGAKDCGVYDEVQGRGYVFLLFHEASIFGGIKWWVRVHGV